MISKILFIATIISSVAYSQPYYYYFKYNAGYDVPGYSGDIYRFSLATNTDELFAKNVGRVNGEIFSNSDQSEIMFQVRFSLVAIDVNDASRHEKEILSGINEVVDVKDSPKMIRYYITFDDEQDSTKTVLIDRRTEEPIDTIYEQYTPYNSFLSNDQDGLYKLQDDSTGIFFSEYSLATKQQGNSQRCGTLGPFVASPVQDDVGGGVALISYITSLDMNLVAQNIENAFVNQEYVVCNADKNESYSPIDFPWRSIGYLSPNAEKVIIERTIFENSQVDGEYHTGTVYVFDASTGELAQRLSLPPGGKILTFDNYPQTFYYYNDSTNQSVPVNVNTVMPVASLLDTLISLKEESAANGSIDNRGIANNLDSKLENARRKLAAGDSATAKNMLNAFVNEVEAQNGKHLTSEAYALLKYNAEYLIDRLPERYGKGENEKR